MKYFQTSDIIVLILFALLFLAIIGMTIYAIYANQRDKKAQMLKDIEKRNKQAEEKKEREKALEERMQFLKSNYGDITIEIELCHGGWEWDSLSWRLFFFESSQVALIEDSVIPFKKILAYTLTDNKQTISTTKGTANTETSTGSMAGRALVGGVLFGGVGALAGATTAKKDTEINTTTSHTTTHDYIIYLNIDDMANPQRILKFGTDAESANKAAGLFNIIINRNNQTL